MTLSVTSVTMTIESLSGGVFDLSAAIDKDPSPYVTLMVLYTKGNEDYIELQPFRKDTTLFEGFDVWLAEPEEDNGDLVDRTLKMKLSKNYTIPFTKSKKDNFFKIRVTPENGDSSSGIVQIEMRDY